MSILAVDGPYAEGRTSWPETIRAYLGTGTSELAMFVPNPTRDEVEAFWTGPLQLAVVAPSRHALFVAARWGSLPWVDMPFEAHRVTAAGRGVPAGGPKDRLPIRSVLVDAESGIVAALRLDLLDEQTSHAIRCVITDQLAHAYDPDEGEKVRQAVYQRYPKVEQLIEDLAVASCVGEPLADGDVKLNVYF